MNTVNIGDYLSTSDILNWLFMGFEPFLPYFALIIVGLCVKKLIKANK